MGNRSFFRPFLRRIFPFLEREFSFPPFRTERIGFAILDTVIGIWEDGGEAESIFLGFVENVVDEVFGSSGKLGPENSAELLGIGFVINGR